MTRKSESRLRRDAKSGARKGSFSKRLNRRYNTKTDTKKQEDGWEKLTGFNAALKSRIIDTVKLCTFLDDPNIREFVEDRIEAANLIRALQRNLSFVDKERIGLYEQHKNKSGEIPFEDFIESTKIMESYLRLFEIFEGIVTPFTEHLLDIIGKAELQIRRVEAEAGTKELLALGIDIEDPETKERILNEIAQEKADAQKRNEVPAVKTGAVSSTVID